MKKFSANRRYTGLLEGHESLVNAAQNSFTVHDIITQLLELLTMYFYVVLFFCAYKISINDKPHILLGLRSGIVNFVKNFLSVIVCVILLLVIMLICAAIAYSIGKFWHLIDTKQSIGIGMGVGALIDLVIVGYLLQVIPAIVIDNDFLGIERSVRLTYGNYWRAATVLGLAALPGFLLLLFSVILRAASANSMLNTVVGSIYCIADFVLCPWIVAVWLNLYHDLKLRKVTLPKLQNEPI